MKKKQAISCVLLGMCSMVHAHSFYPIKHAIANTTEDTISYHLRFLGDASCERHGFIKLAHIQQVTCESGALFKPGLYQLDFKQGRLYSNKKVHCLGFVTHQLRRHKKLVLWKISKKCQVDLIET
ncbi:MAG: hypothetical protein K0U24_02365 [Gammaproteobacteria bacterium]|nr:hypothetical protein [Gammaproteobacteria bacterium]